MCKKCIKETAWDVVGSSAESCARTVLRFIYSQQCIFILPSLLQLHCKWFLSVRNTITSISVPTNIYIQRFKRYCKNLLPLRIRLRSLGIQHGEPRCLAIVLRITENHRDKIVLQTTELIENQQKLLKDSRLGSLCPKRKQSQSLVFFFFFSYQSSPQHRWYINPSTVQYAVKIYPSAARRYRQMGILRWACVSWPLVLAKRNNVRRRCVVLMSDDNIGTSWWKNWNILVIWWEGCSPREF